MNRVYLAKAGKIFGPYTEQNLLEMSASGELERFAWVWKSLTPGWHPLDPMPAPIDESTVAEVAEPAPRKKSHLKLVGDLIEGICHDYHSVVAGTVVHVTETGCELLVPGATHGAPKFTQHARVFLNLLNSKTGQTMDIAAQLGSVSHSQHGWTYRIEWQSVPELFEKSA
jgi:hypothetical protein